MKVLFVCYANVGRSQIAKGFYNHFTGTENAEAAGVGVDVHNLKHGVKAKNLEGYFKEVLKEGKTGSTVDHMNEVGVDVSKYEREQLTAGMLPKYDLVVNIAERRQTPEWLRGDNVVWWNVIDPAGKSFEDKLATRNEIKERVEKLVGIENSNGDFSQIDDGIDEVENE